MWAFGTMFFTALLTIIAYFQLNASHQTQKADFAHRLKNDFFTDETRELMMLFSMGFIEFLNNENKDDEDSVNKTISEFVHFKVNNDAIKRLNTILSSNGEKKEYKKFYTDSEIDDLLLGHMEDIGFLLKQGSIDILATYELFGDYIITVWEHTNKLSFLGT